MSGLGSGAHLSREFFELVKAIGESKSKQEEDRIVSDEVVRLKKKIPEAGLSKKTLKEMLVRLVYVEMLGHDGSFGYIKAVELCASTNLIQKRVGYLAAALVLSPQHDFRFMLVNQLQRDMASGNQLEVWAALTALPKLVTADMVPAVLGEVVKLLAHKAENLRKKAIMCLHRCHQLSPDSVSHLVPMVRRALCDRDPAVMGATVCLLHDLALVQPQKFKDLVPSFVSILKQITEHRLPREFDYHRMPAPWIQLRLLRVLALLGHGDQSASEGMYEILIDVMRRADTGINVGYAVLYQCVRTITHIYPNHTLLDAAAAAIARFIKSENHNLKYLGITGLAEIVKDHPKYAAEHQLVVIECLEDPDETLKRKTLNLLYRMINPVNVEFIIAKLLAFLEAASDDHLKKELVSNITTSAERFAPSNAWYVRTVTRVLEVAPAGTVQDDVASNLMVLIAEGSGEDDDDHEMDRLLRCESVAHLAELLVLETDAEFNNNTEDLGEEAGADQPRKHEPMPPMLLQIVAWVLGEYGALIADTDMADICPLPSLIDRLCAVAEQATLNADTRAFFISALLKLCAQTGTCSSRTAALVELYSCSADLNVQQRCLEFYALLSHASIMQTVLPVDASCEDLDEDGSLTFLDTYVAQAISDGAQPYVAPEDRVDYSEEASSADATSSGLKYDAYAAPAAPPTGGGTLAASLGGSSAGASGGGASTAGAGLNAGGNQLGVKKANALGGKPLGAAAGPWGAPQPPPPAPTPPPPPLAAAAQVIVPSAPPPPPVAATAAPVAEEPPKPKEMSERERQAAMLFGGVGSSSSSGDTGRRVGARARSAAQKPAVVPSTAAASPVASSKVVSSAPAGAFISLSAESSSPVDLLNFDAPPLAPSQAHNNAVPDLFGLSDLTISSPAPVAATPPSPAATVTAAAPPPQPQIVDPFAAAGLSVSPSPSIVGGVTWQGVSVVPLQLTTPAFGGKWTGMAASEKRAQTTLPASARSAEDVGKRVASVGFHTIEVIAKTNEVILAGQHGPNVVICVHAKVALGGTAAITVRSSDPDLSQAACTSIAAAVQAP